MVKAIFALFSVAAAQQQPTFEAWKIQWRKIYNGDENTYRQGVYETNVAAMDAHNADNAKTYTEGANQFSAFTPEEFKQFLTRAPKPSSDLPALATHEWNGEELSASIDWTTQGAVTGVKDQGSCGGCWSFAATGGLEGAMKVGQGSMVSLSEQQFLDCDKSDSGCNGGLEYTGWDFFKNSGICTEASYPYKAKNGNCASSSCTIGLAAGRISGVNHVATNSESALKSALNKQPVAVGVKATAWQSYSSGILSGSCSGGLDHSVLAVGYSDGSHWKVKNSWGTSWGENGYIRVQMSGDKCGILEDASYPSTSAAEVNV